MPRLSLGMGVVSNASRSQGVSPAPFSPSQITDLSLWLKADAGVTTTPETFISEVVISGAGTTTSNGTYERAPGDTVFEGPNGNQIYLDGEWVVYDNTLGDDTYRIDDYDFNGVWNEINGSLPVPTSSTSTTPTGNTLVTWADQSSNNNNFSGLANLAEDEINDKPAIYFDGVTSYLDSPSTLLDNFGQISLFGVWYILGEQSNKGIFGTSSYSNLEITANPGVGVRIRNGNYAAAFIPSDFSNLGAWTISYLDAQNQSGVFYKNGTEAISNYLSQIIITGAGTSTSNGTYTRASGGETQFDGPNGNFIYFAGDWYIYDAFVSGDTYVNGDFEGNFAIPWTTAYGSAPVPTHTLSYPITVPTAVQMPLASGVTYSLGRYAYPGFQGLNAEMYVAEFIIYNRRLTTPERQQVEAYLNSKYAIY